MPKKVFGRKSSNFHEMSISHPIFAKRRQLFYQGLVKRGSGRKILTLSSIFWPPGGQICIFEFIFRFLVEFPTKYMTFMAEVDRNRRWSGPFALFSQIQRFRKNVRSFFLNFWPQYLSQGDITKNHFLDLCNITVWQCLDHYSDFKNNAPVQRSFYVLSHVSITGL